MLDLAAPCLAPHDMFGGNRVIGSTYLSVLLDKCHIHHYVWPAPPALATVANAALHVSGGSSQDIDCVGIDQQKAVEQYQRGHRNCHCHAIDNGPYSPWYERV